MSRPVNESQAAAYTALFTAINKATEEVGASGLHETSKAQALRDLALAYRYVSGGTQPGSSVVTAS